MLEVKNGESLIRTKNEQKSHQIKKRKHIYLVENANIAGWKENN